MVENFATGDNYWRAYAVDAHGRVTQFRLGGGANSNGTSAVETIRVYSPTTGFLDSIVTTKGATLIQDLAYSYNALGNLLTRTDARQGLTETFQYDTLNRVTQITTQTASSGTVVVTLAYDVRGSITSKSDVGTYTNGVVQSGCGADNFAGPRAVTKIVPGATGSKNTTYCYDANGNMTAGDGRTIAWSAFNLPTSIVKGTSTLAFSYGPDRARFKRVDTTSAGQTVTRYIGGKAYEEISRPDGALEKKAYIGGFAVVTQTFPAGGGSSTATRYFNYDHLGSLDVITNGSGNVAQRLSFDAWGKRRDVDWAALDFGAISLFDTLTTTRGFTGHEMVDPVALVHMNGRVYDPEIGRFLSADPFIQDISDQQAWNRYSYVLNNPLSLTDPTGFFFGKIFKAIGNFFGKVFSGLASAFKAVLKLPIIRSVIQIAVCISAQVHVCVATAGALAIAAGGSLGDAVKAMAFSAASWGIWGGVGTFLDNFAHLPTIAFMAFKGAVHGMVGGALSVAQGGGFLEGFAANAIGGAAGVISDVVSQYNQVLDTVIVATAGGMASVVAGGSFANGALTAAFANLYNKWKGGPLKGDCIFSVCSMTEGSGYFGPSRTYEPASPWTVRLGDWVRRVFGGSGSAAPAPNSAAQVGPYAHESIVARSSLRDFTAAERSQMNRIGSTTGCHTCGQTDPGTKSGNFIPDHQPPSALNFGGGPQRLYLHCINCSRNQGLEIARKLRMMGQ